MSGTEESGPRRVGLSLAPGPGTCAGRSPPLPSLLFSVCPVKDLSVSFELSCLEASPTLFPPLPVPWTVRSECAQGGEESLGPSLGLDWGSPSGLCTLPLPQRGSPPVAGQRALRAHTCRASSLLLCEDVSPFLFMGLAHSRPSGVASSLRCGCCTFPSPDPVVFGCCPHF